jgi:hypothetical protein
MLFKIHFKFRKLLKYFSSAKLECTWNVLVSELSYQMLASSRNRRKLTYDFTIVPLIMMLKLIILLISFYVSVVSCHLLAMSTSRLYIRFVHMHI